MQLFLGNAIHVDNFIIVIILLNNTLHHTIGNQFVLEVGRNEMG